MRSEAGILAETLRTLAERRPEPVPVERVVTGSRLLAVELADDTGGVGVARRPDGRLPDGTTVVGTDAHCVAAWSREPSAASGDPAPTRAVGLATLNALSAAFVPWEKGDPMAALSHEVDAIATVGLFRPAFRKWRDVEVRVVERAGIGTDDAVDAPESVTVSLFEPTDAAAAFEGVDVLFVTGSALVYGGLEEYLRTAREVPTVVLVGATASFLPDPAFGAGVTLLAGARVRDPARVFAGIEAGLCGTDLHDDGLEKVYVARDDPTGLNLAGSDR